MKCHEITSMSISLLSKVKRSILRHAKNKERFTARCFGVEMILSLLGQINISAMARNGKAATGFRIHKTWGSLDEK